MSGLEEGIVIDETIRNKFTEELMKFDPKFMGNKGFDIMISNIGEVEISPKLEISWYSLDKNGVEHHITDFLKANLSNGDLVWAKVIPTQAGFVMTETIESSRVTVEGLRIAVGSTSQILMISLITASSILFIGLVAAMLLFNKIKKLKK